MALLCLILLGVLCSVFEELRVIGPVCLSLQSRGLLYVTICYETSLRSRHLDEGASRCIVGLYSDPMVSFQLNEAFKHEVIP